MRRRWIWVRPGRRIDRETERFFYFEDVLTFQYKGWQTMTMRKLLLTSIALFTALAFSYGCSGSGGSSAAGTTGDATTTTTIISGVFQEEDNSALFTALNAPNPDARSLGSDAADWYKDAVFYHLWMSAFNNGDSSLGATGEGDIAGIVSKLDYLQNDLGVTAIWLSPFVQSNSSASNRHNYDATDLTTVNTAYGTNANMFALIKAVHDRGMKIIFDWVPNHVSNMHPWFTLSASSTSNAKSNWFIWKTSLPSGWTGMDSSSDFYYNSTNKLYYYGVFWSGMPDLNYRAPGVRNAMGNSIQYWLDAGFDGMRVDAVKYLYEDWSTNGTTGYIDQPLTFEHFQQIRSKILDAYANKTDSSGKKLYKFMIAENSVTDKPNLLKYMNDGGKSGFNMTLDFPFLYASGSLSATDLDTLWKWESTTVASAGGWTGAFTSNHDNFASRPMSNFNGDGGKVRAQAALQMTAVGTPFIYYGNEIGMLGKSGSDINLRQPFDWTSEATEKADLTSILNWHKALITARKNRSSLRRGSYTLVKNDTTNKIFAFERDDGSERTLVVANLNSTVQSPALTLSAAPSASAGTIVGTHNLSVSGSTITVASMQPYAVRIIALEGAAANLIGDYVAPADAVYLRGSFANWDPGTQMTYTNGIYTLTTTVSAVAQTFKFYDSTTSTWYGMADSLTYDSSIGGDPGVSYSGTDNIAFTSAGGSYTFYFDLANKKFSIDAP